MVQVPAHGSRRESEQVAEFGGTDRPVLQDRRKDAVPGALIRIGHRTGGRGDGQEREPAAYQCC